MILIYIYTYNTNNDTYIHIYTRFGASPIRRCVCGDGTTRSPPSDSMAAPAPPKPPFPPAACQPSKSIRPQLECRQARVGSGPAGRRRRVGQAGLARGEAVWRRLKLNASPALPGGTSIQPQITPLRVRREVMWTCSGGRAKGTRCSHSLLSRSGSLSARSLLFQLAAETHESQEGDLRARHRRVAAMPSCDAAVADKLSGGCPASGCCGGGGLQRAAQAAALLYDPAGASRARLASLEPVFAALEVIPGTSRLCSALHPPDEEGADAWRIPYRS